MHPFQGWLTLDPCVFSLLLGFITILHQFQTMLLWIMVIFINLSFYAIISLNHCVSMRFDFKMLMMFVQGVVGHGSSITFENHCVTAAILINKILVTIFKIHIHYFTIYTSLSFPCHCITLLHEIIVFGRGFIPFYW